MNVTLLLAAVMALTFISPVTARSRPKARTVVGCIQAGPQGYALATRSKKGKARQYTLVGRHDFTPDVGHTVRVTGTRARRTITVQSVQVVAPNCRPNSR